MNQHLFTAGEALVKALKRLQCPPTESAREEAREQDDQE